jgi:hypothetical protein
LQQKFRDEGKMLAKELFPELKLVPDGDPVDKYQGIDAYLNKNGVQIKYDKTIYDSHNLYHEIYEKTKDRETQEWRQSGSKANFYLFITKSSETAYGFLIKTNDMADLETNKPLVKIKPTSIGFLLPMEEVKPRILKTKFYKLATCQNPISNND